MDTLSSPASTLKVPALHSAPRDFYPFKTTSTSHHLCPPHLTPRPSSISKKPTSLALNLKPLNSPRSSTSYTSSRTSSPSNTHRNPASGYAAALLDIAQSNGSLEALQKDIQRLWMLLQNEEIQAVLLNPVAGEKEKGRLVKEVAKKGKFDGVLVRLVKMLVERNKVMMVNEVLVEFLRIYDELSGTKIVLVSSDKKMEEHQLFWIAQNVKKISGALKVKIRNVFDVNLPSLAY